MHAISRNSGLTPTINTTLLSQIPLTFDIFNMAQGYNDDDWFDLVNWNDVEANPITENSNDTFFSKSTEQGQQAAPGPNDHSTGGQSQLPVAIATDWKDAARSTPPDLLEQQKQAFLNGDFGGDERLADAWGQYLIDNSWPAPEKIDMVMFNQRYNLQTFDRALEEENGDPALEGSFQPSSTVYTTDPQVETNLTTTPGTLLEQYQTVSDLYGAVPNANFSTEDFMAFGGINMGDFVRSHNNGIDTVSNDGILSSGDFGSQSVPLDPWVPGPFSAMSADQYSRQGRKVESGGAGDTHLPHVKSVQHHLNVKYMGREQSALQLVETAPYTINNKDTINKMDNEEGYMSADEGSNLDQLPVTGKQNDNGEDSFMIKEEDLGQDFVAVEQQNEQNEAENLDADIEGNYPPKFDLMNPNQFKKIGAFYGGQHDENKPSVATNIAKLPTSNVSHDGYFGAISLDNVMKGINFGEAFSSKPQAFVSGGSSIKCNDDKVPPTTSGPPPLKKRKVEVLQDENDPPQKTSLPPSKDSITSANPTTQDRSGQTKRLNKLQKQKLYAAMEDSGNLYTGEQIMILLNTDPGPGRRNAVWVQRHPYNSTKLYNDSTKTWCRYVGCEGVTTNATVNKDGNPVPKNHKFPRTIISGNYQVAIDTGYVYDDTSAFANNKKGEAERQKWKDRDVFNCNEAFFHLECFEKMVDFVGLIKGVYVYAQAFMDYRVLTADRKWNQMANRKPKGGTNPAEIEYYLKDEADRWVSNVRYKGLRPEAGSDGCLSKLLGDGKMQKNDKKNSSLLSPALQKKLDG